MEQFNTVGRWKLDKTLGQGSYGVVKRANHAHTQARAAIKIVDTTKLKKPSERVALRREVSVHYTLKHRNVVEVLEVFERSGYIFIVMELLEGGDLFNHIVEHGKLEEDRARAIFVQMLNAIWYCHANSVVHRDLKLENFLIDKEGGTVKLTDFGFCNVMSKERLLETYCGSPYYCAPEIFMAQKYEGKAADIWSLGVILYAILTGSLPFVNPQGKVMFDKLMVADCPYPSHLSDSSKNLIKKMLRPTPSERCPITELLSHPWVNGPIPASLPLPTPATPPTPAIPTTTPTLTATATPTTATRVVPTPTTPQQQSTTPTSTPPATPSSGRPRSSSAPGAWNSSPKETTSPRSSKHTSPKQQQQHKETTRPRRSTVTSPTEASMSKSERRKSLSLSGTWKKMTDLFALQIFASGGKKLENKLVCEKEVPFIDCYSAEQTPMVTNLRKKGDSSSSSSSSSANSSTGSSYGSDNSSSGASFLNATQQPTVKASC